MPWTCFVTASPHWGAGGGFGCVTAFRASYGATAYVFRSIRLEGRSWKRGHDLWITAKQFAHGDDNSTIAGSSTSWIAAAEEREIVDGFVNRTVRKSFRIYPPPVDEGGHSNWLRAKASMIKEYQARKEWTDNRLNVSLANLHYPTRRRQQQHEIAKAAYDKAGTE